MTRETKVGLMMVALLVGVFGFLLYKRIHKPLEGLATQESAELQEESRDPFDPNRDTSRQSDQDDSPTIPKPRIRKVASVSKPKKQAEDDFFSNTDENEPEFSQPVEIRPKLNPPKKPKGHDDDFAQFEDRQVSKKSAPIELPPETTDDDFDQMIAAKPKNSRTVIQAAASSDQDPFSTDPHGSAPKDSAQVESVQSRKTLSVPQTIEEDDTQFGSDNVERTPSPGTDSIRMPQGDPSESPAARSTRTDRSPQKSERSVRSKQPRQR